jgi:hypothetical protein
MSRRSSRGGAHGKNGLRVNERVTSEASRNVSRRFASGTAYRNGCPAASRRSRRPGATLSRRQWGLAGANLVASRRALAGPVARGSGRGQSGEAGWTSGRVRPWSPFGPGRPRLANVPNVPSQRARTLPNRTRPYAEASASRKALELSWGLPVWMPRRQRVGAAQREPSGHDSNTRGFP